MDLRRFLLLSPEEQALYLVALIPLAQQNRDTMPLYPLTLWVYNGYVHKGWA